MAGIGARQTLTIFDWDDTGVRLDPARVSQWRSLVRDAWYRHGVAVLLVSGSGYADETEAVTCLVHPPRCLPPGWFGFQDRARTVPRWQGRFDEIVFRGSTSGDTSALLDEVRVLELQRTRALLALRDSDLPADVAFSNVCQVAAGHEDPVEALLADRGILGSALTTQAMTQYRYQLMVDGNHGSWGGHVWKLLSGSTNLWIDSNALNLYDASFEAWTHYIPVHADASDLVDRYRAIRADPEQARAIAKACRAKARKVFTKRYMLRTQHTQWMTAWQTSLADSTA
jgi:hypothetical protein